MAEKVEKSWRERREKLGWWEAVEGFIQVEVFRTITLTTTRQNGVGNAEFIEGPVEQQKRGARRRRRVDFRVGS
jgi:hypothetical protein